MSYWGDVEYEVWRHGGNPDRVDRDRCDDAQYRGIEAEDFAHRLLRESEERIRSAREAEMEAEYNREMELQQHERESQ